MIAKLLNNLNTAKQNQKFPFHFLSAPPTPPAEENKKGKENFWFLPATAGSGRGAQIGAYDLVSSHHARGACDIICFENRFELGTINTPIQNSTAFSKPKGGTREARPSDFPPFSQTNSEFLARLRAPVFRQEAGSKSEAILTEFALPEIQKEFLLL